MKTPTQHIEEVSERSKNLDEKVFRADIQLSIHMNRQEHVGIGIFAFIVYSIPIWLTNYTIPEGFLFGLFTVAVGSITPDLLEPATSWTHRARWHSKRTLQLFFKISAVTAVLGLLSAFIQPFYIFYILAGFPMGYWLHLRADSTTKVGLPDS